MSTTPTAKINYRGWGSFPFLPMLRSKALANLGDSANTYDYLSVKMTINQASKWLWSAKTATVTWNLSPGGSGSQDIPCCNWWFGNGAANQALEFSGGTPIPDVQKIIEPYDRVRTNFNYPANHQVPSLYQGCLLPVSDSLYGTESSPFSSLCFICPGHYYGLQPGNTPTPLVYDDSDPSFDPNNPIYVLAQVALFGGYANDDGESLQVSNNGYYAGVLGFGGANSPGTPVPLAITIGDTTAVSTPVSAAYLPPHDPDAAVSYESVSGSIDLSIKDLWSPSL